MKFRALIELAGTTATSIEVPAAVFHKLESSKRQRIPGALGTLSTRRGTVHPVSPKGSKSYQTDLTVRVGMAGGHFQPP